MLPKVQVLTQYLRFLKLTFLKLLLTAFVGSRAWKREHNQLCVTVYPYFGDLWFIGPEVARAWLEGEVKEASETVLLGLCSSSTEILYHTLSLLEGHS